MSVGNGKKSNVIYGLSATALLVSVLNMVYLLIFYTLSISTLRVIILLVSSLLAFAIAASFMYSKLSEKAGFISSIIILVVTLTFAILDITQLQEQPSESPDIVPAAKQGQDPVPIPFKDSQQQPLIVTVTTVPTNVPQQQPSITTEEALTGAVPRQTQSAVATEEEADNESAESIYFSAVEDISYYEKSPPNNEDLLPNSERSKAGKEKGVIMKRQKQLEEEAKLLMVNGNLCFTEEQYKELIKNLVTLLEHWLNNVQSFENTVRKSFEEIIKKLSEFSKYPAIFDKDKASEKTKKTVEDIVAAAKAIFEHYKNEKGDEQDEKKNLSTFRAVGFVDCALMLLQPYQVNCTDSEWRFPSSFFTKKYYAIISSKFNELNSKNFISMIKEAGKTKHCEIADDKFENDHLKKMYERVGLIDKDIDNAIAELEKHKDIIEKNFESCKALWEYFYFSIRSFRLMVSRHNALINMINSNRERKMKDIDNFYELIYKYDRDIRGMYLLPLCVTKGWNAIEGVSGGDEVSTDDRIKIIEVIEKCGEHLIKANNRIMVYIQPACFSGNNQEKRILEYSYTILSGNISLVETWKENIAKSKKNLEEKHSA